MTLLSSTALEERERERDKDIERRNVLGATRYSQGRALKLPTPHPLTQPAQVSDLISEYVNMCNNYEFINEFMFITIILLYLYVCKLIEKHYF